MFPQIFGKYVLERELASGGMARVFLATLRGAGGFEKRLCVKQIRPELASDQCFIQRFVAEAKTTVDLSHANIVPVYELGAEQGTYYIAMELCAGVSLAELLRAGPMSPSEGAYIGVEICRALDYAHRKAGVVHRDVTPRNVMIDPEGMVRVIDFGIAAPASSAAASGGLAFGSPGHMPPEQLRGGPLTPAADVFAVAVLLIEAWTGRPPFRRETFQACVRALDQPPPRLGQADPALTALERLIESALTHTASERPQTAEELARPLREFLRQDDLGDIARRLGKRVSDRLRALASEAPPEQPGSLVRATSPSVTSSAASAHAPYGTETFAAHEVLRQWTAKIESWAPPTASAVLRAPAELDGGLTAPRPSGASERTHGRRLRVVVSGLALGSCALLALALLDEGRLALLGAPRLPAPAVAALSAPALAVAAEGQGLAGEPKLAAAFEAKRATDAFEAKRVTGAFEAKRVTVGAEPQLAPGGEDVAAPRVTLLRAASSEASIPPARPKRRHAAPAAAAAAQTPLARLQLTAEPAAWVELDATRLGHTPLMSHASSPGRHTITFVSQLLGEKLEAAVTLDPSTLTRVHADFTSANPRLIVR